MATVTAPSVVCGGTIAVIFVSLTTVTFWAGAPPKVTDAPGVKYAPVIVTLAPPVTGPLGGLTACTRGVKLA
jgi:hypothetical protein